MTQRPYEILPGHHGSRIKVYARGSTVMRVPRLNRGTAFSWERTDRAEDLKAALT